MTAGELITYLKQFDQDRKVFVIYDWCAVYPANFYPFTEQEARSWSEDGISAGDLVMKVG